MIDILNIDFDCLIKKHRKILEIIDTNKDGSAKFVGGCVRDFIAYKIISNDIDISTILEPEEVVKRVLNYKKEHKYVDCVILDKDKKYGTIIVILDGQKYEITTTRCDIACYGRQADVKFCKDYYTDSLRRDFTINAFYIGLNNKLLDFHNGVNDLRNGIISFIGNPDDRIKEDYLRIIRFLRFNTKFKVKQIDNTILDVLKKNKNGLFGISRERIRSEIFKILEYDNWFFGLFNIAKNGFLKEVFLLDNRTYTQKREPNFYSNNEIVKLFYFFNYNFDVIAELKDTLKFTKKESKFADFLSNLWKKTDKGKNFNIDAKMIVFYDKNDFIKDVLNLFNEELKNEIIIFTKKIKSIPITTQELIDKGYKGKELGDLIRKIEFEFVKSGFKLDKENIFNNIL